MMYLISSFTEMCLNGIVNMLQNDVCDNGTIVYVHGKKCKGLV